MMAVMIPMEFRWYGQCIAHAGFNVELRKVSYIFAHRYPLQKNNKRLVDLP